MFFQALGADCLDLVYPPQCASCGIAIDSTALADRKILLCADCRVALTPEEPTHCPRCAASTHAVEAATGRCGHCRDSKLHFEAAMALGRYQDALRTSVLRMKWPDAEPLARAVGRLLVAKHGSRMEQWRPDVVVPIPMHWTRRLARGTNSAETLAAAVAGELHQPCSPRLLARIRRTRPQSELPRTERLKNLRDAIRVSPGCRIQSARVLLVDDILTSGATCEAATKALLAAGASAVAVAIVARAFPD